MTSEELHRILDRARDVGSNALDEAQAKGPLDPKKYTGNARWTPADIPVENNPKRARALLDGKVPMEQIPLRALEGAARVLEGGARKYGFRNWRREPIAASTYIGAILRHTREWQDGSDADKDSGQHPLAHVLATCLVVLDAIQQGTFIDDRGRTEVLGRNDMEQK